MANNAYACTGLTGNANGDLDAISAASLSNGDMAWVVVPSTFTRYIYTYDGDSALGASSPRIIRPTDFSAAGEWILVHSYVENLDVDGELDINSSTPVDSIIDDDTMATADDANLCTGESIKAYVDGRTPSEGCLFRARPAAQQSGAFDGATTTVVFGTEDFDIGSNFAANTFTAPNTGYYQFNVNINLLNVDGATTTITVTLSLSGSDDVDYVIDPSNLAADGGLCISFSTLTDMGATDTAHVEITDTGEGAEQMTLETTSSFSGFQVA